MEEVQENLHKKLRSKVECAVRSRRYYKPVLIGNLPTDDLDNMYKSIPVKFKGMIFSTSYLRFAWVLAKVFERTNPQKAKEFAKYGLSRLRSKETFFARTDFENILKENNGA